MTAWETVVEALDVDAAFQGGLDGTLVPSVALGPALGDITQIINAPAGRFVSSNFSVTWAMGRGGGVLPEFDDAIAGPSPRFLESITFFTNGVVGVQVSDSNAFGGISTQDLADAFESTGTVTVEAGGETITIGTSSGYYRALLMGLRRQVRECRLL